MLEKMDDFFTARVDGYDEHMKEYMSQSQIPGLRGGLRENRKR